MKDQNKKLINRIEKEKGKRRKIEELGVRSNEPNLKAVSDALDEFYFLDKIKLYCAYLSYSKIVNAKNLTYKKTDFQLIDAIIQQIESRQFSNKLLALYNNIRLLYETIEQTSETSDKRYIEIFQYLKKHTNDFPQIDLEELYSFLSNYCIRQMNSGVIKYRAHYFLVNNEFLNLKYGTKGKKRSKLPGSVLKNTVSVATFLQTSDLFQSLQTAGLSPKNPTKGFANAFEWLEAFIPYYGARLSKKDQKLYLPYCQALVEFEQKNFVKAYRTLQNPVRVRGVFMNMNIKILYLRVLYEVYTYKPIILETDGIEIEKVLESFRGLIRDETNRKKELAYQLEFYVVFEKYYRQVFRFYQKYTGLLFNEQNATFTQQKQTLLEEIKGIEYPNKDWLLEKLSAIK